MPTKKKAAKRRRPDVVSIVVKSVAERLDRIEAILLEFRFDQARQLKRMRDLQVRLDAAAADARVSRAHIRRLSRPTKNP